MNYRDPGDVNVGDLVKMSGDSLWAGQIGVITGINPYWWIIKLTSGEKIGTKVSNRLEVLNESR